MEETPVLESRFDIPGITLMAVLGAAGCICAIWYAPWQVFYEYCDYLGALAADTLFGVSGLCLLWHTNRSANRLRIFEDRLEVISWRGKLKQVIYLLDIATYNEYEQKTRYSSYAVLVIYTHSERCKISASFYANYTQLRDLLLHNVPKNDTGIIRSVWQKGIKRDRTVTLVVAGILYIATCHYLFNLNERVLQKEEMLTVTAPVGDTPVIKRDGNTGTIEMKLNNYPGMIFEISTQALVATDTDAIKKQVRPNDSLLVTVEKRELNYEINLQLEKIKQKSEYSPTVAVYALADANHSYLSFDSYPHQILGDKWLLIVLDTIGCLFIITGLFMPNPINKKFYSRWVPVY